MKKTHFNKNKDINIVLITSNELRHRYVASFINKHFNLVGILSEHKIKISEQKQKKNEIDEIANSHFIARNDAELRVFDGEYDFPNGIDLLSLDRGGSNSAESFNWAKNKLPDIVILYGSCIIKNPLLSYFNDRVINMHLGLSPYYRGSGTNFWPLVDGLPECVGVTIHLAVSSVDAGPILTQKRPDILPDDQSHEIGAKAIIAGLDSLKEVILSYINGKIIPVKQDLSIGKEYSKNDFSTDAVIEMHHQFEKGMIKAFLENKDDREKIYPILCSKNS